MRSRRRTPLAALLASLFLWLALAQPGIARAEDTPEAGPPPEAKKAFADGKAAFERGEYDNALQLFHRAALIAPAPSLYYNIGMAYERLARYEDSAIAFEKYLQLIEAPQTDEERTFQANLRARATANRTRASRPVTDQPVVPPTALVEPPRPAQVVPSRYPQFTPPPYVPSLPPPLTHRQKLDIARRHRNNGIALTIIGGVFTLVGVSTTIWIATADVIGRSDTDLYYGLSLWGTGSLVVIGLPFFIPGAVALAKWQRELDAEQKRPDDGAAATKSALDLAVPPPSLRSGVGVDRAAVFSVPVARF